jgi:hypothetical protein
MIDQKEELKGLYIEIEKDFHKKLKSQSVIQEMSMKDIIVLAVTDYLERNE